MMRSLALILGLILAVNSASAVDFGVTGLGNGTIRGADESMEDWEKRNAEVEAAAAKALAEAPVATSAAIATQGVSAYTLGPGDKVKITVFGEDDLSGQFIVEGSGSLALPLMGEMPAVGKTVRELEKSITEKLSEGYLVNPRVNVEVLNFRPFFILGEVSKPGSYPYVNDLSVINAVAMAGGYTARAKTGTVLIKRASDPARKETEAAEDAKVFPGDVIRVDERFF